MRIREKSASFPKLLLALPFVAVAPGVVRAQAAAAPGASQDATPGPMVEEVLVTGSRIAREDYVAESPMVTVSPELIQSMGGVTLESAMNGLPQLVTSAGASANTGGGQAKVNLRGLGSQRTLVLLDGRRMQPANADGSVDLNMIPPSIVQSVEVITGGASAVYGSDAVTGVVNFKLRRDIEGIEATAQYGAAQEGDAQVQDYSVLAGMKFAEGRGSSILSLNYTDRGDANAAARRPFGRSGSSSSLPEGNWNVDSTNLPTQAAMNTLWANYGFAPGTVSRTARLYFNTDGSMFLQSTPSGPLNYRDGFEGLARNNLIVGNALLSDNEASNFSQTPLERINVFGYTDYEVSPSTKVFVQAQFADFDVTGMRPPNVAGSSSSFIPTTIPVTNPFIPADLATLLASRPRPLDPITITKRSAEATSIFQKWSYTVNEVLAGASGSLPWADMTWNVYGSSGKTRRDESFIDYANNAAINRLLDAPDGGVSICEGGFDPFGLHAMSQECLDYVNRQTHSIIDIETQNVEMNLSGSLFELPAGKVQFAVGADYRNSDFESQPDGQIASGEIAGFLPIQATEGSTDSIEAYTELLVPLLAGKPAADELNLSLAYRFADYDTIGGVSTYKAGLDWRPIRSVMLRGGYSRAIRAPSVGELFAPESLSRTGLGAPGAAGSGDGCDVRSAYRAAGNPDANAARDLCLALGMPLAIVDTYTNTNTANPALAGGNPDLEAETADTYSFGVVLRPQAASPLLSTLSLSVDYYSIELKGAVGNITSLLAMQRCFNADGSNPTYDVGNFYCGLISRLPTNGDISVIENPLFNLGGYRTTGVDIGIDWALPMSMMGASGAGELRVSSNISYLDSFEIQTLEGAPFFDYAGTIGNTQIDPFATARPEWKGITTLSYRVGPATIGLNWRYLGKMENAANVGTNGTAPPTEAMNYFDLNARYTLTDSVELRAGIVNVMDKDPPIVTIDANGQAQTNATTYDIIGRRYFVNMKVRF